ERGVEVAAAELPLEGDVAGRARVELGRARLGRLVRRGHRREHLPVDRDLLGGVAGGVLAVRDHHRHRVAHVAGGVRGQPHGGGPVGRPCPTPWMFFPLGRPRPPASEFTPAMSAPVNTATTPGWALALPTSMLRTRAWACGLRTNAA